MTLMDYRTCRPSLILRVSARTRIWLMISVRIFQEKASWLGVNMITHSIFCLPSIALLLCALNKRWTCLERVQVLRLDIDLSQPINHKLPFHGVLPRHMIESNVPRSKFRQCREFIKLFIPETWKSLLVSMNFNVFTCNAHIIAFELLSRLLFSASD